MRHGEQQDVFSRKCFKRWGDGNGVIGAKLFPLVVRPDGHQLGSFFGKEHISALQDTLVLKNIVGFSPVKMRLDDNLRVPMHLEIQQHLVISFKRNSGSPESFGLKFTGLAISKQCCLERKLFWVS